MGHANNAVVVLQFLIDALCVFGEQDIRKAAYASLQTTLHFMNAKLLQS